MAHFKFDRKRKKCVLYIDILWATFQDFVSISTLTCISICLARAHRTMNTNKLFDLNGFGMAIEQTKRKRRTKNYWNRMPHRSARTWRTWKRRILFYSFHGLHFVLEGHGTVNRFLCYVLIIKSNKHIKDEHSYSYSIVIVIAQLVLCVYC